jgi:cytoskeletal protein RodZ
MTQEEKKNGKKQLPKQLEHSNFWALLYVWCVVALILAGIGALLYWAFK